jgi:hypothetical protein
MYIAAILLVISIILSPILYKELAHPWISYVLILTFSRGIITLFIYASSLMPTEWTKNKKNSLAVVAAAVIIITITKEQSTTKINLSIKTFSSRVMIIAAASFLIFFMCTISTISSNPMKPILSNYYEETRTKGPPNPENRKQVPSRSALPRLY